MVNEKNEPTVEGNNEDEEMKEDEHEDVDEDDEESDDASYHEGDRLDGYETGESEEGSDEEEDDEDHEDSGRPAQNRRVDIEEEEEEEVVVPESKARDARNTPARSAEATTSSEVINVPDDDENILAESEFYANEYYKMWKKNAMYLYDLMITHTLTWPSLTVEWIPEKPIRPTGKDYSIHRLVMGTNTSGTFDNYLIIFRAHLPHYDLTKVTDYNTVRVPNGYGSITAKLENFIKIPHEGDINKARTMIQNPFLIATKSSTNKVLLFDFSKHSSEPESGSSSRCRPQLIMEGHTDEGYGLSWNHREKGRLLSGSQDGIINIYDINQNPTNGRTIEPLRKITSAHANAVCDVQWHYFHANVFASVGTDKEVKIWDFRNAPIYSHRVNDAHKSDVNTISFNPFSEWVFLTGSKDKTVALWDLRNLKLRLHVFEGHTDEVFQVTWSPTDEAIFASASADKRVHLWDIAHINHPQTPEDAKEGPPELMFIHGGHTDRLCDISWNPTDPFLMASVAENNSLHLWKMGEHINQLREDTEVTEGQVIAPKPH